MPVDPNYMSCVPWQPDMGCCSGWEQFDPELLARATDLAWMTLRVLSGGQVGNCPITVRPCLQSPCQPCAEVMSLPRVVRLSGCEGCWKDGPACGGDGCSCSVLHEIVLAGSVAQIVSVRVDGAALAPDKYRVDNGNRLVRTDGEPWPSCQYMERDPSEQGTLAVDYVPGIAPGRAGLWAAGVLVCEFVKACSGSKCRLPSSVTSISRQGISMELSTGMFPDGMVGIREVDAYLTSVNPYGLRSPSKVWSPDAPGVGHRYSGRQ